MSANTSTHWQRGRVVAVRDIAQDIRRIEIETETPVPVQAGTHIDIAVTIGGGIRDIRSYSVVDSTASGSRIALSVFKTATSRGGSLFMHSLQVGDNVELTQPIQNFPLRVGAAKYVILAGGVGITALVGMGSVLARLGADYRFIFAARNRKAMAYLSELQAEHGDRLEVHVDDEGTSLDVHSLVTGLDPDTELYMCGPIRLMDAVRREWQDSGLTLPNLRYETFGNSGWFEPVEFIVRVPRLGLETVVPPGRSMLEALEAAGADMMFDCRKGECGLCEVQVLDVNGAIDHRDVFYSRRQQQSSAKMCCCVSRVTPARSPHGEGSSAAISIELS
jgi:ferredoxin-NADP reductase